MVERSAGETEGHKKTWRLGQNAKRAAVQGGFLLGGRRKRAENRDWAEKEKGERREKGKGFQIFKIHSSK
jgi:hypothetical protein